MLEGNYNEVTEGTIIEKHSSNKASELVNSVAKAGGKAADKWINEKNSGSTSILKSTSGLVELGVTFLINKGLNSLFGSFIGSKKKDELKIQTIELSTTGSIITLNIIMLCMIRCRDIHTLPRIILHFTM